MPGSGVRGCMSGLEGPGGVGKVVVGGEGGVGPEGVEGGVVGGDAAGLLGKGSHGSERGAATWMTCTSVRGCGSSPVWEN